MYSAPLIEDPEALEVRAWRYKLQKAFLSRALPKEEDMPALDNLFTAVENYDKMNIQYLQFTKINKVMRYIAILPIGRFPGGDKYNFRERAKALLGTWDQIINANKSEGGTTNGAILKSDVGDEEETVMDRIAALNLNGTTDAPASAPEPISTEAGATS